MAMDSKQVCYAFALIEDILNQANDTQNIEEINKITRNYCSEMSDQTFSKILERSREIRHVYYPKFLYKN